MVFSYYLLKYPYTLIFKLAGLLGLNDYYAAYCGDVLDYYIMKPVLRYLPELRIISKDKKVREALAELGVKSGILPAFPRGVLMCRLAAHKFPAAGMKKIGMRHGPFHFKALSGKRNYMLFDLFLFTSEREAEIASQRGITNGVGVGYPKLDRAFNGEIGEAELEKLRMELGFAADKKTLLFTSTWEGSGMSAIAKWYDKLPELTGEYNIMVSLHPWIAEDYRSVIRSTAGVHYIQNYDTTPYIMLADICIGDTSSILGECCALDKPMITFEVGEAARIVPYVMDMINEFSLRISRFDELKPAIERYRTEPDLKKKERRQANAVMFSNLDGTAGEKSAELIRRGLRIGAASYR